MAAGAGLAFACALPPYTEGEPGAPLPELDEEQLRRFAEGQALFNRPFTVAEGLGPIFNQDRCGSCHDLPTSGGHGAEPVVKAARFDPVEGCTTLPEHGGDLLQQIVTEPARALGVQPEQTPEGATITADIRAPAVYGLGLVAAVPEADLLRRADPDDTDADGISGRANFDADGRVGRFGRRAQHATLRGFVEEAIRLEMGITTPSRPSEELPNGRPLPEGADLASDPEVDEATLQLLTDYIRFLAPPRALAAPGAGDGPTTADAARDLEEGAKIFDFMGCAKCHVPSFTTAASGSPSFDRRRFRLYSDLLLHDMGPELAGPCTPGTSPSEWKTARLVGLGHRFEFLHDGRAPSIEDAILLHGGEATPSRDLFRRLASDARRQVLLFLQSL